MKTRLLLLAGISLLTTAVFGQQDPLYSQYNFNKLAYNPAYAGVYDMASITSIYRQQWIGLNGPSTLTLSGNTSLPLDKAGAGITIINDRASDAISNTEVEVAFSYKLVSPSGDNKFSMGLNAGFINNRVDNNKISTKDPNDVNFQGVSNISKPTVGFGLFYTTPKYFAGLSVPKILNVDFDNGAATGTTYERHYYLNAGYLFETSGKDIKFVPSFWLKAVKGANPSLDLNLTTIINEQIWLGISLRNTNTIVLSGQLQISDVVKAGIAYDLGYRDRLITYPSFEFMLNFGFPVFDFHAVQPVYF